MYASNPWFWAALFATIGLYKLELFASLLNLKALSPVVPERLKDFVTEEVHERTLEYARTNARADFLESSVQLVLFITFWWCGGFRYVDEWVQGLGWGAIASGLTIFALLYLAQSLLSLPFDAYNTFWIEAEFGFNRTTVGTFIQDRVKGTLILAILGLPLLGFILWLFMHVPLAAMYAWITLTAVSLLMTFLAPRLLFPLFYKFEPLPDENLRAAIIALSHRLDFPVTEVSLVDGSRRSSKANAFFTGFGKLKRIALYDTLVENHSQPEILAVLSHEIGHSKRKHVPRQVALSLLTSGLMFGILHFAVHDPRLSAAFGVTSGSVAWSLLFFSILYAPLSTAIGWISGSMSRKFEYEADAFAKDAMGSPEPMVNALTKLSRDHLSNPTPHPVYIFLHYSHPTVLQRMEALQS